MFAVVLFNPLFSTTWVEGEGYSPPYHGTLALFPLVCKDVVYNVNISESASDQATKFKFIAEYWKYMS